MTIVEIQPPTAPPIAYNQLQSNQIYKVASGGQYQGYFVEKGTTGLITVNNSSDGIDAVKETLEYILVYGVTITN